MNFALTSFNRQSSALVLETTYGYQMDLDKLDPLVSMINTMTENACSALLPLSRVVDIMPAVKLIPEWFPGGGFTKRAREWNKQARATAEIPYQFTREQMGNGSCESTYVSKLVQECAGGISDDPDPKLTYEDEEIIRWTANSMYAGSVDTIAVTITGFILAMIMFPDVQRKAQEEIDHVLGNQRLPDISDRQRLPYVNRLVQECYRWASSSPSRLPPCCFSRYCLQRLHNTERSLYHRFHLGLYA